MGDSRSGFGFSTRVLLLNAPVAMRPDSFMSGRAALEIDRPDRPDPHSGMVLDGLDDCQT